MKKLNPKILAVIFVTLIVLFILSRIFRAPNLEGNLNKQFISLDTATIDEIKIVSPLKEGEIKFSKQGSEWFVNNGQRNAATDRGLVNSLLGSLSFLKPTRLASRKKEKWDEYNVGEKGIHLTASSKGKNKADIVIGKSGFSQGGGYTFMRLTDNKEVYAIEGYLESTFNKGFNDWRDKVILKLKKPDITKITYQYPADSAYVIEKQDSVWMIANRRIDSDKVDILLNQLSNKSLNDFIDDFKPTIEPVIKVQIDSKKGNLASLSLWKKDEKNWVLTSSLQKDIYFSAPYEMISTDVLPAKKTFLPALKTDNSVSAKKK